MRASRISAVTLLALPVAGYIAYGSLTGECAISAAARGFSGEKIPMATAADRAAMEQSGVAPAGSARETAQPETAPDPDSFNQTNRPGSVDLETTYDLTGLSIPREQIHTLLPKDAIPSLTDPALETVAQAGEWLSGGDRVIDITIDSETVGVPLKILTYHEIANLTVAGRPVAATYCPLCDSVTLVSREIEIPAEGEEGHDLARPAPGGMVLPAGAHRH